MFCPKKSTKRISAGNDYESLYSLLLDEAHQITFHQQCINSLMMEVCKYLNGHSLDIMNDIFKLRENKCQSPKFPHLANLKSSFTEIVIRYYSISC